jgi:hypothetical protein
MSAQTGSNEDDPSTGSNRVDLSAGGGADRERAERPPASTRIFRLSIWLFVALFVIAIVVAVLGGIFAQS